MIARALLLQSVREAGRDALQKCVAFTESGGCWAALQVRGFAKRRSKKRPKLHGPSTWPKVDREKWHKDLSLDSVVERDKNVQYVIAMKDILASMPGMQMPVARLGSYKRFIGTAGDRNRPAAWLNKYPNVFEVHDRGTAVSWFTFTPEALGHVQREKEFWAENEGQLVNKVRKILMMAPGRRLSVDVLAQLKRDLGLPEDFRINLVMNHPDYFRVVDSTYGPELELTEWDPELAVSAFERMLAATAAAEEQSVESGEDVTTKKPENWVNWSSFRNKSNLKKRHVQEIVEFHQAPPVSPYFDRWQELEPRSLEAERHAVAVLHELLSLTLRKRVVIDRLAHYRKLFRYTKQTRSICIQHPEIYYVSLKNCTETVFLRDAYKMSELVDVDPFLEAQAWVGTMIDNGRVARKLEKERLKRERRQLVKAGALEAGEASVDDESVNQQTEDPDAGAESSDEGDSETEDEELSDMSGDDDDFDSESDVETEEADGKTLSGINAK